MMSRNIIALRIDHKTCEPFYQIFENASKLFPIDGLQKSRERDQSMRADIIDISRRGLRSGPEDDSQSFLEAHS